MYITVCFYLLMIHVTCASNCLHACGCMVAATDPASGSGGPSTCGRCGEIPGLGGGCTSGPAANSEGSGFPLNVIIGIRNAGQEMPVPSNHTEVI